uniref:Ig-like domain-containing protein n=1 Tax=Poecilia reticulata TaxID=8081 RepID=A0A3P9N9D2_POERE
MKAMPEITAVTDGEANCLNRCACTLVRSYEYLYVSLTCTYSLWKYGRLPFCWARGSTSAFGCNNEVLKSDGTLVTSRLSWRYDLRGNLGNGEASLTIAQVQEGDSGKYICRVEIPGWFNDQEVETTLNVQSSGAHTAASWISVHLSCKSLNCPN